MIKPTIYSIFIALLFINGTKCSYYPPSENGGFGPSALSPTWQKDNRVQYSSSGGMIDESENLTIYTDSAIYIVRGNQMENKYKLVYTKNELDAMAKVFYDNKFDKIQETETGLVYDKGTQAISICNSKGCIQKAESANTTFKGEHMERLRKVTEYVLSTVRKKYQAFLVDVPVNINKNILNSKYTLQFQTAPGHLIFNSETNGKVERDMVQLAQGVYRINATTFRKAPNGGYQYKHSAEVMFDTQKHKELAFAFNKDSVLVISTFNK